MILSKIRPEDLIFYDEIGNDRTNTHLVLSDYDWMNYTLSTRFVTNELGNVAVKFEYFGATFSTMLVEQTRNGIMYRFTYEYPTDIFLSTSSDLCRHIFPIGMRNMRSMVSHM